jgi:hypothetical protein
MELPQLFDTREFATARKELSCKPAATSAREVPLTVRGTLNVIAATTAPVLGNQLEHPHAASLSKDGHVSLAKKSSARSGGRPNQLEKTGIWPAPFAPGPS